MPLPALAAIAAAKAAPGLKRAVLAKMGRKGVRRGVGAAPTRRRPRRIVFSENQWGFVQQLLRMAGGVRVPSFPRGRRRRKGGRPFGGQR